MTREEYEERRRRLDEQLRAGFELLEAGHRQQVEALDREWMAATEEPAPLPRDSAEATSRPEAPGQAPSGIHREALAALSLFCEAARQETATVDLARGLAEYLCRARHDPELRFEAPDQ